MPCTTATEAKGTRGEKEKGENIGIVVPLQFKFPSVGNKLEIEKFSLLSCSVMKKRLPKFMKIS
jgi:hypothetical protein